MQAVVVTAPGQVEVQQSPLPQIEAGQILIKVCPLSHRSSTNVPWLTRGSLVQNHAVALNPTDWKVSIVSIPRHVFRLLTLFPFRPADLSLVQRMLHFPGTGCRDIPGLSLNIELFLMQIATLFLPKALA